MIAEGAERTRLRYHVLLEPLSDEDFDAVCGALHRRHYAEGEVILEDNSHGSEVFFLVEGRVRITKRTSAGEDQLLALLHPGDAFGEMELIAGRPRAAAVSAMDDVVVYTMDRPAFLAMLASHHEVALRLLQVLSVRVRALNHHFIREANAILRRTDRELRRFSRLVEATKKLNSTLELEPLLDIILEIALEAVDGERGTIYLIDAQRHELWTKVATGLEGEGKETLLLPIGKGIAGYVAGTGDALSIPDAYADPRFDPSFDRKTGYTTSSILCVPMRKKDGDIVGVFQLLNKRSGVFTDDDMTFIEALSVHAALAIENARLHEQERQKIRIERDLKAAHEVQMSLLPRAVPEVPGYEFAASTIPALEVAGDLYDFIPLEGGKLAFCLGDVSGKGLAASLLMANMQATMRDQAHIAGSAAECVRRTNLLLSRSTAPDKFVTLFFGILDPAAHTITYCNAGHEPGLLLASGMEASRLGAGGVILGIMEEFPFEAETVDLESGAVVVIYSDGISEATDPAGVQFGALRVEEVIREQRHGSAEAIRNAILAAVRSYSAGVPQADDITLLVCRRTA